MSWTKTSNVKSYYLYHHKGEDIIDYISSNDYFYIISHLICKFDTYILPSLKGKSKFKFTIKTTPDGMSIVLTVNDQNIFIDSGLDYVSIGDMGCSLLAQEQSFKTEDWNESISRVYKMVVDADLTPNQLARSFSDSFEHVNKEVSVIN